MLLLVLGVRREDLTGLNLALDFAFLDEDLLRGILFFLDVVTTLRLKREEEGRFALTGLNLRLVVVFLVVVFFFFLEGIRELGFAREDVVFTLFLVKLLTTFFCA